MTESELEQQAHALFAEQKPRPELRVRLQSNVLPAPKPTRRWVLAVGTLAVVGVVGGVFLMPRRVSALAAVEEALLKVNTASWDETMVVWDNKGKETQRIVGRHTLRINPPAVRDETTLDTAGANAGIRVWTTDGAWLYDSKQKKYIVPEGTDKATKADTAQMQVQNQQNLARMLAQNRQSILAPSAGNTGRNWKRTNVTLKGRPAIKFTTEWTDTIHIYDGKGGDVPNRRKKTIWADPRTHLMLRVESESHSWRVGTRSVSENIHYDQPLPAETFAPAPPAGAPCFVGPREIKKKTPLPEQERAGLRTEIARLESAWVKRDFSAFSAEYDFAYLPTLYANPGQYPLQPFADRQEAFWTKRLAALKQKFPKSDIVRWELEEANRIPALLTHSTPLLYRPLGEPAWIEAVVYARTATDGMFVHRLYFRTLPTGQLKLFYAQLNEVQEGNFGSPGVFGM